ncbi:MAG: Maf family protein [Thalassotalea sp.]
MIILASKSPRRKELLEQLGLNFICDSADIDESVQAQEIPSAYVQRLAIEKAQAVAAKYPNDYVLGSDTSVVIAGEILGKPNDQADSARMLQKLSGQRHQVYTAIAVVHQQQVVSQVVTTYVDFKNLTADEIQQYWRTGEPQDKAGSYAIQGIGGQFIIGIEGSYSSVVGLPLYETAELLKQCGQAAEFKLGVSM